MIKQILRKLIYREKSSGEKYIAYCKRGGGATIGNNVTVYSAKNTTIDETSLQHIFIGDNTQITAGVIILAHDYSYSVLGNIYGELPRQQRDTIIGKNVFIGMNSIILMGSNIGDNVIIGAWKCCFWTYTVKYCMCRKSRKNNLFTRSVPCKGANTI